MEIEERLKYLKELNLFINNEEQHIDNILNDFGWDKNLMIEDINKLKCNKSEVENITSKASIKLDKTMQASIIREAMKNDSDMKIAVPTDQLDIREVPKTESDYMLNFSRDEKLALYKYYVEQTGHFTEPEISIPVGDLENSTKVMTFAEIVAYKRNLKRRRMKYRVTKEAPISHNEEIRRLISTQMEAFIQYKSKSNEILSLGDDLKVETLNEPCSSSYELNTNKLNRNVTNIRDRRDINDYRKRNTTNTEYSRNDYHQKYSRRDDEYNNRNDYYERKNRKRYRSRSRSRSKSLKTHKKRSRDKSRDHRKKTHYDDEKSEMIKHKLDEIQHKRHKEKYDEHRHHKKSKKHKKDKRRSDSD